MWLILALLSAVFAALTSILAKVGIEGVNSNLATAIRTAVVLVMAWGMVFVTDAQNGISSISTASLESTHVLCIGLRYVIPKSRSVEWKSAAFSR